MESNRVVVTGIGVVAPNGTGVKEFRDALYEGRSGIKYWEDQKNLNMRCQISGRPTVSDEYKNLMLTEFFAQKLRSNSIIFACLAGVEAWTDAGLKINNQDTDYESGMVFGAGDLTSDSYKSGDQMAPVLIDGGESRRLGSRAISENMNSGASAYLNSLLGLGNRIISNSSACATGTEAILLGYEHIKSGRAKRMICGSTESDGRYLAGGFDAMRVLCSDSNENPEFGSRPLSDSSSGFVPGGGAAAIVLESMESALERGVKIYAEILGGDCNSGGQRNGGTMTAPNSESVIRCIKSAIKMAGIQPSEIDLVSGHLTSTKGDPIEIQNWVEALSLKKEDFPYVNTPKSLIGHCIGAAGSIELVANIIQLEHGFIHPNLNTENLHPDIANLVLREKIPMKTVHKKIETIIKSNFGFGDLNCVIILRKWSNQ